MDQFTYRIGDKDILVYRSIYAPVKSNMFTILTGKEAIVFDPNKDEHLLFLLKKKGIEKVYILLTHGHYDHISGVEWLKERTGAQVFCQEMCAKRLMNPKRPLARMVAMVLHDEDQKDGGHRYYDFKKSYHPFIIKAEKTFEKEEILRIGTLSFKAISTPGHSEGSTCYELFDKFYFTGDTLLQNDSIILTFPGGNKEAYENETLPYLRKIPNDSIIMPGHGDPFYLKDTKNI